MGGELWAVEIPVKNLMVVGIDSYHDVKNRSVGGFVASTNQAITRWYSRVCFQERGQELIDGLRVCLMDAIKQYHKVSVCLSCLPEILSGFGLVYVVEFWWNFVSQNYF